VFPINGLSLRTYRPAPRLHALQQHMYDKAILMGGYEISQPSQRLRGLVSFRELPLGRF